MTVPHRYPKVLRYSQYDVRWSWIWKMRKMVRAEGEDGSYHMTVAKCTDIKHQAHTVLQHLI
jgi:hypothetical protein